MLPHLYLPLAARPSARLIKAALMPRNVPGTSHARWTMPPANPSKPFGAVGTAGGTMAAAFWEQPAVMSAVSCPRAF